MLAANVDHESIPAESKEEPRVCDVRIRRPNVTIDQTDVKREKLLQLKSSSSAAKGVVTRKQNEARVIMSNFGDLNDLEGKRVELDDALRNFLSGT